MKSEYILYYRVDGNWMLSGYYGSYVAVLKDITPNCDWEIRKHGLLLAHGRGEK